MRQFGAAFALALCALRIEPGAAQVPTAATTAASGFSSEKFSGAELLTGARITEAACAGLPTAVWLVVGGQGECVRYYHSTAGGSGREALVYLHADAVSTNGRGEVKPNDFYLKESPAGLQNLSVSWSRSLRMPYLALGRPGTYGSSGEHAKRRTPREIDARLGGARRHQGRARLYAPASRRICRGRPHRGGAAGAAHRYRLRGSRLGARLGPQPARRAGAQRGLDRQQESGSIRSRSSIGIVKRSGPAHLRRDRSGRCRDLGALADALFLERSPPPDCRSGRFSCGADPTPMSLGRAGRRHRRALRAGRADDAIVATYQNKCPKRRPMPMIRRLHSAQTLRAPASPWRRRPARPCRSAVWVRVEGRTFCVRYWISTAGGKKGRRDGLHSRRPRRRRQRQARSQLPAPRWSPPASHAASRRTSGRASMAVPIWRSVGSAPSARPAAIGVIARTLIEVKV